MLIHKFSPKIAFNLSLDKLDIKWNWFNIELDSLLFQLISELNQFCDLPNTP